MTPPRAAFGVTPQGAQPLDRRSRIFGCCWMGWLLKVPLS